MGEGTVSPADPEKKRAEKLSARLFLSILWVGFYSSVSSSACQRFTFASLGIRLVVTKSACLCFPLRGKHRPLPCSSSPHRGFRPVGGPGNGDWRGRRLFYSSVSSSACQRFIFASLGIRQSPRGDMATVPTLGPSGRQLRLNCWLKKRR